MYFLYTTKEHTELTSGDIRKLNDEKERMRMKKFLCLLLALVMTAAVLTGCGVQATGSETNGSEKEKEEENKKENRSFCPWKAGSGVRSTRAVLRISFLKKYGCLSLRNFLT